MISFILAFLTGDLWLQTFSHLPSTMTLFYLSLLSVISSLLLKKYYQFSYIPFAFLCGFLYSVWYAHSILSWTIKHEHEGKPLQITGIITSIPITGKYGTQFEFYVEKMKYLNSITYPNSTIKLTWPDPLQTTSTDMSKLKMGDTWQLLIRLKRIHGTQNPSAFDYEAWAFQKGIRATGSVINHSYNKMISHPVFSSLIHKLRRQLYEKIILYSPHTQTSPWLMGLIMGERRGISQENWQVLRNTGTNHLMVIGGLHIGILAAFTHFIISWLWRRIPNGVFIAPAQYVGTCAALFIAIIYSSLSGFSIPTQRASIMLTVFSIAILSNRKIKAWNAWSLALFCVLLFNPMSVLIESFWLSFGTIALIIYGMSHRLFPSGIWWKWGRVQWIIGIGLIPLTLMLFQECSLVSFIANTIAIPWLGFTILPLCFLSAVFLTIYPAIGGLLLLLADKSLSGLWLFLSWISHFHFSSLKIIVPNIFIFLILMLGFILMLLPAGVPGRWLGFIWILPVLLYKPVKPQTGEYWLTLLDVGQGLSAVIQTKSHILVYDAGPKFDASIDMGESIVIPYLRTMNTKKLDMLMISHADNDHIGGAPAILQAFPQTHVKTSAPEHIHSPRVSNCKSGEEWVWDDVHFTLLYPMETWVNSRNDNSCVLLIDNGHHKTLLTGDIEKYAETTLLTYLPEKLKTDIIIAPHHGSKTSGSPKFISAVNPEIVLYATGYRNRYHFPHQSVITAYDNIHAKSFNTVDTGSIQFKMTKEKEISSPDCYRFNHKKYWFDS